MPILVKDYDWEESEETVRITVPLKGVKPNKVDIFSTEEYIKVSYPPYLFEVFLFAPVEDVKNKATVGNGVVVFSLIKKEAGLWGTLQPAEVEDKEFTRRKREEAIRRAHERAEEEQQLKETQKREQERYALRQQMKREEEERKRIEEIKEEERRQASAAIEEMKNQHDTKRELSMNQLDSDDDADDCNDGDNYDGDVETNVNQDSTVINGYDGINPGHKNQKTSPKTHSKTKAQTRVRNQGKNKKKDILVQPLPAPRQSGCIQVSFTPRAFKTAARESKAPEEEEWLKKVAEANRNKKTLEDDPDAVDMEEMNPLWLKDKGIGFYKSGNYVAAINAFTAALVLDSNIPSLFSNRAACHLHMKQYKESVQDCTSALELLTPPVPDNASSRCKAFVRRGTALFQLDAYVEALKDYEEALKLDPKNASLQSDADKIRHIIQGTS